MAKISLKLAHLYPRRMNIYGDRGNIMTFARRAEWRGIGLTVDTVEVGDALKAADYDLFFFGGGQDQEQDTVAADLVGKAAALREAAETGAAMLAVCGGYQLFGRYYQPAEGERLEGVGIFDAWTEAGPDRLIGNVVVEPTAPELAGRPIVGFENHSGLTHLAEGAQPLGRVIKGAGNTGRDGTEGCVAGSAVGTYLHGSLLPKNPHLADWLLGRAVARRHPAVELQPLDDSLEQATNATMVKRFS